ncbi:MAG: GNAT family N-acetyltransferase [Clostridia bacterium]|nr:GNAT family N-acetyltransferase [Clostridia bacterium]
MDYEILPLTGAEEEYIEKKIGEYAYAAAPPPPGTPEAERLVFKALDKNGNFFGGCTVNVHEWGRAVLGVLWVDESCRGHGLGSMLMIQAERAARNKGCRFMCLGTMDFMARGFYEKHGYRVFTVNRDYPRGHEGWSLSKRLDLAAPDCVPSDNSAAGRFTVLPGGEEDVAPIHEGLSRYNELFVPDAHGDIPLGCKLADRSGRMVAGIAAEVDGWNACDIAGVWVEESYRGRGLGSFLLAETEREAKLNGAYVLFTQCCDWVKGFFGKNGFVPRGELPDYPAGHTSYELEKRI